jgi:hypothetical protein
VDAAQESLAKKLWPVWVSIGLPCFLVILNSTPVAPNFVFVVIGTPVLLSIWACLGIWALVVSVRRIRRRDWSRAATSAVLPLVILIAGMQFRKFHLCNYGGDVVHFMARRSAYLEEIRAFPPVGEPRLLVFNRGGMQWSSRGYVYDENDELLRSQTLRPARWTARADQTELSCGYYAEPFPGHFSFTQHWYIASFNC